MDPEADPEQPAPEPYDDEILDANWMPRPEAPLRVIRSAARDEGHPPTEPEEAEAFLEGIYRNQE